MKKTFLFSGLAAVSASLLLTGCGSTEVDRAAYYAELNNFIAEGDKYVEHTPQKTEDLANVILNGSKVLYVNTGLAYRDEVELRFGDAETLRVSQSIFNTSYNKKWEALRKAGDDEKSKETAAKATEELKKALTQIQQAAQTKKTADELFEIICQKRAFNDYVEYKQALKQAGDKKESVEKKYAPEKKWLELGKKIGETGALSKEARAKAAAREQELEKSQADLDRDLHKLENTVKYWTAFVAKIAADIAYDQVVKNAGGNGFAIKAAELARNKSITEADRIMAEVLQEQPEEATRFVLPLEDPAKCVAILKDKCDQYGYALVMGKDRLMYIRPCLKWLSESNEALNDAAGE